MLNNVYLYELVRIVKMHHCHIIGVTESQVAIVVAIPCRNEHTCIVFGGANSCILLLVLLC